MVCKAEDVANVIGCYCCTGTEKEFEDNPLDCPGMKIALPREDAGGA